MTLGQLKELPHWAQVAFIYWCASKSQELSGHRLPMPAQEIMVYCLECAESGEVDADCLSVLSFKLNDHIDTASITDVAEAIDDLANAMEAISGGNYDKLPAICSQAAEHLLDIPHAADVSGMIGDRIDRIARRLKPGLQPTDPVSNFEKLIE